MNVKFQFTRSMDSNKHKKNSIVKEAFFHDTYQGHYYIRYNRKGIISHYKLQSKKKSFLHIYILFTLHCDNIFPTIIY